MLSPCRTEPRICGVKGAGCGDLGRQHGVHEACAVLTLVCVIGVMVAAVVVGGVPNAGVVQRGPVAADKLLTAGQSAVWAAEAASSSIAYGSMAVGGAMGPRHRL